ncbi:MAG: YebC/PmpR family DNA-binding transcriptional regulator [Clostridia bacterium]|nr:YebC/PmpR family DNA-binding transcriptional regulator [Clostridia bacterium]MDE7328634.1 YebC/PmpR family DNA-binding transcriptional regulator [Clostridia bacterium]
MSGHSKWANIKNKKGKSDAKRASVFTKIGREIAVAVKQGGPDPSSNSRLRDVIAKAKANNMPNDNIERGIKKASGELSAVNYEENIYEGYGAGGVAVIVETLTDNKNRTAGDIRHHFDKCGGAMGTSGCVSYMFETKGVIVVDGEGVDEDELMMVALDCGAEDILNDGDIFEIYTDPNSLGSVRENLEKQKTVKILSADVDRIPNNTVKPDKDAQAKVLKLLDMLEDNDDVQNVYHNAELDEDED